MSRLLTLKQYFSGETESATRQLWINRITFAALIFALTWAVAYPFISPFPAYDLDVFLVAARDNVLSDYYYAPWLLPFFKLFTFLPYDVACALANVVNVLAFLYAVHVFKGNKILLLTSYSLMNSLFYGQMDGLYALGLAWMFIGLKRQNVLLVSLAWMLAGAKFYIGIPLGVGLLWCYGETLEFRVNVIVANIVLVLFSFVLWPNWVPDLLVRMQETPPHTLYSIDTWSVFGPVVLLLWVPVLLSRTNNYLWWVATWALTLPYLQLHGFNQLLVMPVGLIGWIIQLNFVIGFSVAYFVLLIPLWIYIKAWWESWRTDWLSVRLHFLLHRNTSQPIIANEASASAD